MFNLNKSTYKKYTCIDTLNYNKLSFLRYQIKERTSIKCSAKKKGVRLLITLECTEARAEGGTPSRYITQKNKKNTPNRLELMKYNPLLRRHTLHREIK